MKITKIAQAVPQGYVKLRVTVGKTGDFKSQFIREGASQCGEGSGEFLDDIMNTQVEGFGDTFEEGAPQKTEEYWEQQRPQVPTPVDVTTPEEEDLMVQRPERQPEGQQYGV
jgi:hypothetical protein